MKNKIYASIFALIIIAIIAGCILIVGFDSKLQAKNANSITENDDLYNTSLINGDNFKFINFDEENSAIKRESACFAPTVRHGSVVIEQSTGRILYGDGENSRCYPASTTKILTCLIALNNLNLDKVVKVPKEAAGVEGSSIYLKAGSEITVRDLLYGMMLRSGNDAATALAIEISESLEKFAKIMNETAKALGATDSNFKNPHGLHDDEHYTTALDLARICAAAYRNDEFKRIVNSKYATIKIDGEPVRIQNKNKFLSMYEGGNGVKTGFTKKSGRCLVSGAERDGMQLVAVVLNCGDMWNESMRIMDYAFDNYRMTTLAESLLTADKNAKQIKFDLPFLDGSGNEMRFPLRRDGSERL